MDTALQSILKQIENLSDPSKMDQKAYREFLIDCINELSFRLELVEGEIAASEDAEDMEK